MMLNLYPKPNYHNIPNIMVFLVPETQMNIESIDPKSGKEVYIGSELVVRLPTVVVVMKQDTLMKKSLVWINRRSAKK